MTLRAWWPSHKEAVGRLGPQVGLLDHRQRRQPRLRDRLLEVLGGEVANRADGGYGRTTGELPPAAAHQSRLEASEDPPLHDEDAENEEALTGVSHVREVPDLRGVAHQD